EIGALDKASEGYLKQYVDGSPMTFNRKHRDHVTARPTARLTFATNNLPRFHDHSDGIWRRLLLLRFRVQIADAEKVPGMDKPQWWHNARELPGIFNWAAEGLQRLKCRGDFKVPEVCRAELAKYREDCNPAHTFLTEHFEADSEPD